MPINYILIKKNIKKQKYSHLDSSFTIILLFIS